MVRNDILDEICSRERIAAAIVVALLAGAVSAGAVGMVAAGATDPALADSFGVAEPRAGDRGVYTLTVLESSDDGTEVVEGPRKLVEFERYETRWLLDREGQPHRVNPVYSYEHYGRERDGGGIWGKLYHLDAGTGLPVGEDGETWESTESNPTLTGNQTRSWSRRVVDYPEAPENLVTTICGIRNALQGEPRDTEAEIPLFASCTMNLGSSESVEVTGSADERPRFRAVATDRVADRDAVVYEMTDPGAGTRAYKDYSALSGSRLLGPDRSVRVWFAEDLPYPLRIEVEHRDGEGVDVVRLARFARGSTALEPSDGEPDPAPPLETAPRRPWGMDETGVEVPYPLSEAYRRARDDPEDSPLAGFLEERDEVYTEEAVFDQEIETTSWTVRRERNWTFRVTDGEEALCVSSRQIVERRTLARDLIPDDLEDDGERSYEHRFEGCTVGHASPDRIPDRMPTVRSLMDRWAAYASQGYADAVPNSWGFRVEACGQPCQLAYRDASGTLNSATIYPCEIGEPGCRYAHLFYWAGVDRETFETDETGLNQTTLERYSLLQVDGEGRAEALTEHRREQRERSSLPAPLEGGDDGPAGASLSSVSVPVWTVPTGVYALGAAIIAALSGLIYWAWPGLKQVGLASLYTRITRDEALDNETRAAMMELIRAEPGIHFHAVSKRLGLAHGTTEHHLAKLVDLELVTERSTEGYKCYFPHGEVDRKIMEALPAVKSEGARRVLATLSQEPDLSNQQLAEVTGYSPSTVNYHVKKLEAVGLVEAERQGKAKALSTTDVGDRVARMTAS